MTLASLQPEDTIWIYNDSTQLYVELKVVQHNADSTTRFKLTGVEQARVPENENIAPSLRVESQTSPDGTSEIQVVETSKLRRLILKIKSILKRNSKR